MTATDFLMKVRAEGFKSIRGKHLEVYVVWSQNPNNFFAWSFETTFEVLPKKESFPGSLTLLY